MGLQDKRSLRMSVRAVDGNGRGRDREKVSSGGDESYDE